MRKKNRYGADRWSKEKRDKHQGHIKGIELPRGPRLDAPGTLHHVIVRGIVSGVLKSAGLLTTMGIVKIL
jgi:hypothetical protein